jgi:alpha-glucosidase (family GH31 glycosyl hydrolase)
MWGENILVAPVLEKGVQERKIYLPQGKWQDISNKTIEGGKWITIPLKMEYMPIFVKEGSFVPATVTNGFDPISFNTSKYKTASAFLGFFPSSKESSFEWYEDDGASKNSISSGNYTRILCTGKAEKKQVDISITPSNDLYLKKEITVSVTGFHTIPKSVIINGKKLVVVDQDPNQWNLHTISDKNIASWIQDSKSVQFTTKLKGMKKIQIKIIK